MATLGAASEQTSLRLRMSAQSVRKRDHIVATSVDEQKDQSVCCKLRGRKGHGRETACIVTANRPPQSPNHACIRLPFKPTAENVRIADIDDSPKQHVHWNNAMNVHKSVKAAVVVKRVKRCLEGSRKWQRRRLERNANCSAHFFCNSSTCLSTEKSRINSDMSRKHVKISTGIIGSLDGILMLDLRRVERLPSGRNPLTACR